MVMEPKFRECISQVVWSVLMILISPWAKQLPDNKWNPKNYPWWPELIRVLPDPIVQVGVQGEAQLVPDFRQNLSLMELASGQAWCSVVGAQ